MRTERLNQLNAIKEKLDMILKQNEEAEEPDQLDRHEIVIDLKSRDQILVESEKQKQAMIDKSH